MRIMLSDENAARVAEIATMAEANQVAVLDAILFCNSATELLTGMKEIYEEEAVAKVPSVPKVKKVQKVTIVMPGGSL